MLRIPTRLIRATAALSALLALSPAFARRARTGHTFPTPDNDVVACTVIEVHPNTQSGATIAIIHQRNKTDQAKFASLLAHADGGPVQIQMQQGPWVTASIMRLRSCFGRGLLMFPAADLKIEEHDTLNVKFSAPRLTAERVPDARN